MRRIYATILGLALGIVALQASSSTVTAQGSSKANQQPILSRSGEIRGVVNFCGDQGSNGIVIHIPGRQFRVKTDVSGMFIIHYVPEGDYKLQIEVPGQAPATEDVHVDKNMATDLGVVEVCPDNDNDTFSVDVDCNDNNPSIFPGADEECDGVDNNCDGEVDEGCVECTDADLDGFPAQDGCPQTKDCDDSDLLIFPGATENCNGKDDNCDGGVDEGFDADGDGFTSCGGDCNDSDASTNPTAVEVCDGADNNCDGIIDHGFDQDGDGFTTCGGDCDDLNPTVFPGAADICGDGVDNDCDGDIDGGCQCTPGETGPCTTSCGTTSTQTCLSNGTWGVCTPPAEICNGIDDNCDGDTDEGFNLTTDPLNCGSCGNTCTPITECGFTGACSGGQCVIAVAGTPCVGGSCNGSGTCVQAVCGNGIVEFPEECDDGNTSQTDDCRNDCTFAFD